LAVAVEVLESRRIQALVLLVEMVGLQPLLEQLAQVVVRVDVTGILALLCLVMLNLGLEQFLHLEVVKRERPQLVFLELDFIQMVGLLVIHLAVLLQMVQLYQQHCQQHQEHL
jgi:hypothetical protein